MSFLLSNMGIRITLEIKSACNRHIAISQFTTPFFQISFRVGSLFALARA